MSTYVLRKLLSVIPTLIGISLVVFLVMNVMPGSPAALMMDPKLGTIDEAAIQAAMKKWGLDQPLHTQYLTFLKNAIVGDLGYSWRFNQGVTQVVLERMPATGRLAVAAWLLACFIGLPIGVLASVRHRSAWDTGSMLLALLGISMPAFWLGLMLMYLFSVTLGLLPPSGFGNGALKYMLMPTLTLGCASSAVVARVTRSAMLNVIRSEYITTARSKGLSERVVIYRHALRNALIPVTTIMGAQIAALLSGAVVTETVFSWPGLGRLAVDSIMTRDLPVVQGCVLLFAVFFIFCNLAVDVVYAVLDPRIRY